MPENSEPVLSYTIVDKEYTLYEGDITPDVEPLYNKVSGTLRLQKTLEVFFNDVVNDNLNSLHDKLITSKEKKNVIS